MLVSELMTADVVTATPLMTLKEADELFTSHTISGAPVVDEGLLVGLISQSDIVRVLYDQQLAMSHVSQYLMSPYPLPLPAVSEIARERAKVADEMLHMTVSEVMTGVPVTVAPDDDVAVAAELMINEHVHRVLVTENGSVVGIVSALDLASLVAQGQQ